MYIKWLDVNKTNLMSSLSIYVFVSMFNSEYAVCWQSLQLLKIRKTTTLKLIHWSLCNWQERVRFSQVPAGAGETLNKPISAEPKQEFFQTAVFFVFGWFSSSFPGEIICIFASQHPRIIQDSSLIRNINKPCVEAI